MTCSVCGFEIQLGELYEFEGGHPRHGFSDKCVTLIRAAHDTRVTQLLEANNAELERRRTAEDQARGAFVIVQTAQTVIAELKQENARLKATLEELRVS